MTTIVNTEFWLDFIAIYRNHPELWNVGIESYKNRMLKNKAYEILAKKLKEIDPAATTDTVRKKINSLRSCYRRELLKMNRRNSRPGITEDLMYVPKLWYFNELQFLENEFRNETVKSTASTSVSEDEIYESYYKSNYEEEIDEPPEKKIRESSIKRIKREFFESSAAEDSKQYKSFDDRDEADIFSQTWAVMYRKLSADQQMYAKKAIDEVLFFGQLGKLALNSFQIVTQLENSNENEDSNLSFSE
ncbi:uncharacterized protein LOC129607135 [Condylostylus longicornis]|uniref:uncharacterized protein LOC129607135 n=1 Tax=Condylostylus longicornis TaxID=2530218 RepID=UPI00244E42DC|nr:uncharacterized protein LOC129607135 [Condylostylus longicornis]